MTDVRVLGEVAKIIRHTFDDETIMITRETTADDIADWDSLSNVELMVALETAFGVQFSTGELSALKNVGALADVITTRVHDARG